MNNGNLIPKTSDQDREEARRNGRKGGIASGAARRDKRNFRETLEAILSRPNRDRSGDPVVSPITGKPMSVRESIIMQTIAAAMKGNVRAVNTILDVLGERIIRQELTGGLDVRCTHYDNMKDDELKAEAARLKEIIDNA